MKTALFIPCYDGHIRAFHLVMKGMEKRGKLAPLVVYIEGVHGPRLAEYLNENSLPYIRISLPAYSAPITGSGITTKIRNGWRYYSYLRSIQSQVGRLFDEHQTGFVLTATDGFRSDVFFLFEAYRRHIPSLCLYSSVTSAGLSSEVAAAAQTSLSHRIFRSFLQVAGLPTRYTPVTSRGYATKISLWGERHYQALMERGADPAKMIITGSPSHDIIYNRIQGGAAERSGLRRSLGLQGYEKVFLFTTQPVAIDGLCSADDQRQMTEAVIDACGRFENCALAIKLHPRESIAEYDYLEPHLATGRVKLYSEEDADLYDLLSVCDVLITQSSTTAMDAVVFGKDMMIIDVLTKVKDAMGYLASGVGLGVDRLDDLVDILSRLFNDRVIQNHLETSRKELISSYLYRFDGKSYERALDLIDEMMTEKH